jgi:HSP20 family protein
MNVVRWIPLEQLIKISHPLDRTANNLFAPRTEDSSGRWTPPVEIFEKQDHLVIRAEVAGVQREDMDVRIENGVLTLNGERKQDTEFKEEKAHRMERVYGAFTRSFSLPTTVDAAKVAATYKDGVLEVTVPKAETAKPKSIEIKAA